MAKRARKAGKPDPKAERDRILLDQLKDVGARIGIEVREEKLVREVGYTVHSGRCRVKGQDVILLDRNAEVSERTDVLLDSLASCDLTEIYLEPEIRRLILKDSEELEGPNDEALQADAAETGEQSSGP